MDLYTRDCLHVPRAQAGSAEVGGGGCGVGEARLPGLMRPRLVVQDHQVCVVCVCVCVCVYTHTYIRTYTY